MNPIRPCPHCAYERCEISEVDNQAGECFAVWCEECDSHSPIDLHMDMAVEKWNRRYGHEAPTHAMFDRMQ